METNPISLLLKRVSTEVRSLDPRQGAHCLDLAIQDPKLVNVRIEKALGGMYRCDG